MKELRQRKPNRLKNYDYSKKGAYFVTICTKNREEILGRIIGVGANCVRPQLTDIGSIIENEILKLSKIYDYVLVDCYVIMPNHVHMILVIRNLNCVIDDETESIDDETESIDEKHESVDEKCGRTQFAPTLSRIIKQWKGSITKQIGFSPWQKSFHDHIIRNENDYNRIVTYIENNPANWEDDCFHPQKS